MCQLSSAVNLRPTAWQIPSAVANMSIIEQINLHGNPLTGELFNLEQLTALTELEVHDARLSGTFPQGEYIYALKRLKLMNIGDNGLGGTLPKEIGRLTALEALLADDNEIKGTIPETIVRHLCL